MKHFHPNINVSALRKKWKLASKDLIFLDPRNATPFYNKHLILRAFASYICAGGPSSTLLVFEQFAKTKYVLELKQLVQELKIGEKVRFVGVVPHDEMAPYYALSDITISIPLSDGLPQSIYEALACGSFLIMNNLPQYHGIVQDGVTAKLVKPNDVDELAEAMRWAASNIGVRETAIKLGRRYVERVADEARQSKIVNQLYEEILAGRTNA